MRASACPAQTRGPAAADQAYAKAVRRTVRRRRLVHGSGVGLVLMVVLPPDRKSKPQISRRCGLERRRHGRDHSGSVASPGATAVRILASADTRWISIALPPPLQNRGIGVLHRLRTGRSTLPDGRRRPRAAPTAVRHLAEGDELPHPHERVRHPGLVVGPPAHQQVAAGGQSRVDDLPSARGHDAGAEVHLQRPARLRLWVRPSHSRRRHGGPGLHPLELDEVRLVGLVG